MLLLLCCKTFNTGMFRKLDDCYLLPTLTTQTHVSHMCAYAQPSQTLKLWTKELISSQPCQLTALSLS